MLNPLAQALATPPSRAPSAIQTLWMCAVGSVTDSALCVAPAMNMVIDLRDWVRRLSGSLDDCAGESAAAERALGLGAAVQAPPGTHCVGLLAALATAGTVATALDAGAPLREHWQELALSRPGIATAVGAWNAGTTSNEQRAAIAQLGGHLPRAIAAKTALQTALLERFGASKEKVVREQWSCAKDLYELPMICPATTTTPQGQLDGVEMLFFVPRAPAGQPAPPPQPCIPRSRTFVVDYHAPAHNTSTIGDTGQNTRWLILNNVPPAATVTVLSEGDLRVDAVGAAALALRVAGNSPAIPGRPNANGDPRTVTSRARVRVVRITHDEVDEVDIIMAEPGRSRSHSFVSLRQNDIAFGITLSLDTFVQDSADGPFGRVTDTDTMRWQSRGVRRSDVDSQLGFAVTSHLFVGLRTGDWLVGLETPMVSTVGKAFRGVGLRLGRRARSLSTVAFWSGSIGLRVERRPDLEEMADKASDLPETHGFAAYVSLGVAFDIRTGLESILPK